MFRLMAKPSVPSSTGHYHHGDLRRALLDATLATLAAPGRTMPSLREVARIVGVTTGAPYHHFRDRGELLATLAAEGFILLRARLESAAAGEPTFPRRPGALARAYLRFGRERPSHYGAMFHPEATRPENLARVEPEAEACFTLLCRAIADANADMPAGEDVRRAVAVWSLVHGMVVLGADGGPLGRKVAPEAEADLAAGAAGRLVGGANEV